MVIPLDTRLADALQVAIETTFRDSFSIKTDVSAWSLETGPLALEPYILCTIEMNHAETKESCGTFIMGFSHETIMKILASYGIEDTANEKVINDAAEEIVNMVYGMVKTSLSKRGFALSMEFPSTDKSKMPSASKVAKVEKMIMPFVTEGHECRMVVAQIF
jgi:hypothetical protein